MTAFEKWAGIALIAGSIILGIATVSVATSEPPNTLAAGILQAVTLLFSTAGALLLARVAALSAARDLLKPHARSAFRRVKNLYAALGRTRDALAEESTRFAEICRITDSSTVEFDHVYASLRALDRIIVEQISTVDDALEDWRDIVPEEVAKIEQEVHDQKRQLEGNQGGQLDD